MPDDVIANSRSKRRSPRRRRLPSWRPWPRPQSDPPAVVGPLQQGLTLSWVAERIAGLAVLADLAYVPALGRLVMSTRERICAIEIEDNGMLMTTLRTAEEVRDAAQMPDVPLPKPDPQMLAIAEKIVDQQAGEFDPSEFVDRYEDALRELIEGPARP